MRRAREAQLLSFGGLRALIAERRGTVSKQAVQKAIERFHIRPAQVSTRGRRLFFKADAVFLSDHLRRPNVKRVA